MFESAPYFTYESCLFFLDYYFDLYFTVFRFQEVNLCPVSNFHPTFSPIPFTLNLKEKKTLKILYFCFLLLAIFRHSRKPLVIVKHCKFKHSLKGFVIRTNLSYLKNVYVDIYTILEECCLLRI